MLFMQGDDAHAWAVSLPAWLGVCAAALLCLWLQLFTDDGWVPLLGICSQRLMVYGGTLFQLAFPAAALWHFWRSEKASGVALAGVWLGENLLNVARYMADASAQALPLVGGGKHDWTEILSRWGLLQHDLALANLVRLLGVVIMLWAYFWLWQVYQRGAKPA